ncbi:phosphoglycolate phosphatase [Shimia gijangensis]|uniref:Phosphoglycolate phosphatase n=1 Tax=Shimia gijangensis TaxID=1470563 RepID=A0A1M6M569_9RHOB|nr:HAD-IA family hydrolase [Shimia gijangensis]SHJ78634.1 phosphoglycolate phosphatase [Shimia gijangensis]
MSDLRLVVFDVDGTLVDSQGDILAAMTVAFGDVNLPVPSQEDILGIVGLSLNVAMPLLAPDASRQTHHKLEDAYKDAYVQLRASQGAALSSPLYPGAREMLEHLQQQPHTLLGVATGKSRRGLDKLLEGHDLMSTFVTEQVADFHPSKPHPSMLQSALSETGVTTDCAVMVGDTSYDMDMARAAGMAAIGVSWGYHDIKVLTAADVVIDSFDALPAALEQIWGR